MELNDALRQLRLEIGMTQTELAETLHMGFSAINRWENQNSRPNRVASNAIIELAKRYNVSASCLDSLNRGLFASRAKKVNQWIYRIRLQMRLKLNSVCF